ncbi:IS4 family transposase IS5377 [Paenibacillus solanacearum]|uniref:IS4 family transposase IS5377 n=1 Tax=Paenibacillus solanacearum TaxID=2048548 RepID=A0A916K9R7_9BACL|nr:IS4 family transposase [Paenibacillus solanacearum]CAG7653460.1 IS4 family transposase IS5377 [Paenibacillus solanacearum]
MKKSTTILSILQSILTPEEVESIVNRSGYADKARKFTVYQLLQYWCTAAYEEWPSYRAGSDRASLSGLVEVHYSRFSSKAAEVPFAVFKEIFHLLVRKCNREIRRKLAFPKELLLIDSTTVTVGKTRLPWAPYHGERSGVKLHVALQAETEQPLKVEETVGSRHDGPVSESLTQMPFIMVMDRAYGKLERLDRFKQDGQSFVIRLRDNVHLEKPKALRRQSPMELPVIRDITCQLGTPQCRSKKRHRVVIFQDFEGREIRVVTDLMHVTAEQIAQIYKARWQIEVFFRWIKQHMNLTTLFGTTENAVYGQLFSALMVYVLLKWSFDALSLKMPRHARLSFVQFSRLFGLCKLPIEWVVRLNRLLQYASGRMTCITISG